MFKKISAFLLFTLIFQATAFGDEAWNSNEGLKRLSRSQFKNDFYQLANFYQPQINPLYCSVASGVIVLNALNYGKISSDKTAEITRPTNATIADFTLFTQESFLNEKTDQIKKRQIIDFKEKNSANKYDPGIGLEDFKNILAKVYGLKVEVVHFENNNEKIAHEFRKLIKEIFVEDKKFIITNFDGKLLGKKTSGHISIIGAYDEESDSILVMDVALHKNQWFWISTEKLLEAMNTKDEEQYRGYIIVSKK